MRPTVLAGYWAIRLASKLRKKIFPKKKAARDYAHFELMGRRGTRVIVVREITVKQNITNFSTVKKTIDLPLLPALLHLINRPDGNKR